MLSFTVTCLLIPRHDPSRRVAHDYNILFRSHWSTCPQRAPWSTCHLHYRPRRPASSSLRAHGYGFPVSSGFTPDVFLYSRFLPVYGHSLRTSSHSFSIPRLTAGFGSASVAVFIPPSSLALVALLFRVPAPSEPGPHAHMSTAGSGFCLLNLPPISSTHIWLRLFYIKCDTIHQANTQLSHISPALFASHVFSPTCAQAHIHPICLFHSPDIPGVRAALYNQDLIEFKRKYTSKKSDRHIYQQRGAVEGRR